jgi:hypothetical protein
MQGGIQSLNAEGIHHIFGVLPPAPADINLLSMVKIDGGWRIGRDGGLVGNYVTGFGIP